MTIYTVHEPPGSIRSKDDADRVIFIKEGISWPALFFPLLWQIWHGLWLVLIAYLLIAAALEFGVGWLAGEFYAGLAAIGLALLFAFEGNNLRRWHLNRKGYRMSAVVSGRNVEEAEARFFSTWVRGTDAPVASAKGTSDQPAPPRPIPQPSALRSAPIGVFPQPGGRV